MNLDTIKVNINAQNQMLNFVDQVLNFEIDAFINLIKTLPYNTSR
jgi:hypothetical protein